jgi:hypothetical protein
MENTSAERMRIALEIVAAASLQVICADGAMRPELTTAPAGGSH